ncbi:MAG TPA: four helix bundle protein [Patescibacteria group bacterium]|nr:four helix bundle protein [Patescibacteria group bacterium]
MDTLPIINRTYELYKAIVDINNHLEKRYRYSLGQSLETTVLDLLQQLIMAKNAPKPLKSPYLIKASSFVEIATLKLRLFLELKIANETKIFQAQSKLAEIGRMLGGWLKSLNTT